MNWIPWPGTKHLKKNVLFNDPSRDLKCFDDVELVFLSDKILDLQYVHMFIFNPRISVANTKLGIEYEYVNMLKIQSV